MLPSPRDAVVGASELESTAAFLEMFGFVRGEPARLPREVAAALYGLDAPCLELILYVPGAERGRVRLVSTPNPARGFAPFDPRPFAIDLFTTDIERSVGLAHTAGYHTSPITDHRFGPVLIREVEVVGPDGLVVTLLQPSAGRRCSILDREPKRLHSEVHAFVWSASELEPLLAFWEACGLVKSTDAVLNTPGLGALVGVPSEDVSMRLVVLADRDGRPVRLEYVDFLGRHGTAQPSLPLAAGLHAPAFIVPNLDAAVAALPQVQVDEIVELDTPLHPKSRAATANTPGGQRFELWEEPLGKG